MRTHFRSGWRAYQGNGRFARVLFGDLPGGAIESLGRSVSTTTKTAIAPPKRTMTDTRTAIHLSRTLIPVRGASKASVVAGASVSRLVSEESASSADGAVAGTAPL